MSQVVSNINQSIPGYVNTKRTAKLPIPFPLPSKLGNVLYIAFQPNRSLFYFHCTS